MLIETQLMNLYDYILIIAYTILIYNGEYSNFESEGINNMNYGLAAKRIYLKQYRAE